MEWIAASSAFCGLRSGQIYLVATMAMLLSLAIFQRRVLPEEKWIKYLGGVFLVFAAKYLLYSLNLHSDWFNTIPNVVWLWWFAIQQLLISVASPFANYLLLVTAISLMGLREREHVAVSCRIAYVLYGSFFANWVLSNSVASRLPDALCSSVILVFLGWALQSNFKRNRLIARSFSFAVATLYGLLKLVYGLLPWLLDSSPELLVSFDEIVSQQEQIFAGPAFDDLLNTAMFFMELGLFLSSFLLILSLAPDVKGALSRETQLDYLSNQGVPKLLCDETGADEAGLLIWLSGKEHEVLRYRWPLESPGEGPLELPMGVEQWVRKQHSYSRVVAESGQKDLFKTPPKSYVSMPILLQGETIGCIYCGWNKTFAFTSSTLVGMRQLTASLVQVVYTFREREHQNKAVQLELELARSDGPALLLHEFRNQTASMSLGMNNLKRALWKEDISAAKKGLERLKSTLQKADVIARAKIEKPNAAHKDHFSLDELLALVEARYKELCESRGIAFKQEILQPDTIVKMDQDAVFLALSNLVANAIDATGKGDTITLISSDHEGHPALHVVNTGMIPAEHQSRLFERGYTTKARGTGLGLPLCQASIRREGGDMFLSQTKENQTKFTVVLKKEEVV